MEVGAVSRRVEATAHESQGPEGGDDLGGVAMKKLGDYTRAQQRALPPAREARLIQRHLGEWILHWLGQDAMLAKGFIQKLDRLCQLNRRSR